VIVRKRGTIANLPMKKAPGMGAFFHILVMQMV
jgi:hypothetical protein